MELKNRNVQHSRNLFDRAVTLLPRVDQLWYKYVYLEELLQNIPGARQVFERWMQWEPEDKAWQAYIKLEERYEEWDRASAIYERWIAVRPEPRAWVKWAKFEEDRGRLDKAREVFQTALAFFGDDNESVEKAQGVFSAFAKMEVRQKEYERARVIYKVCTLAMQTECSIYSPPQFALDKIPRSKSAGLYASYTKFEKQHGSRTTLENTVLGKRRIQYEEELAHDGRNYDVWFDYTRLEEEAYRDLKADGATQEELEGAEGRVRETYERAVAQVPPGGEKRHWRRYIFLWLNYALFEEIETKVCTRSITQLSVFNSSQDYARAREIYKTAIKLVPHKQFTFAKLWLSYAKFEVRRLELQTARKILGTGIGMCPKEALFKGYIDLEIELREFDRARTLYEKYLEVRVSTPTTFVNWVLIVTCSTTHPTPQHGSNSLNLKRSSKTCPVRAQSSNWACPNTLWQCPKFYGKPTSTLRSKKANARLPVPCTRGSFSSVAMLRCGFPMRTSRRSQSLCREMSGKKRKRMKTKKKGRGRWYRVITREPGRCSRERIRT